MMSKRIFDDSIDEADDENSFLPWIHSTRHMNRHADKARHHARKSYDDGESRAPEGSRKRSKHDPL